MSSFTCWSVKFFLNILDEVFTNVNSSSLSSLRVGDSSLLSPILFVKSLTKVWHNLEWHFKKSWLRSDNLPTALRAFDLTSVFTNDPLNASHQHRSRTLEWFKNPLYVTTLQSECQVNLIACSIEIKSFHMNASRKITFSSMSLRVTSRG